MSRLPLWCLLLGLPLSAPADDAGLPQLVRDHIYRDYAHMEREASGALHYPYITPGSVYSDQLWDWDSWLSNVALAQILKDRAGDAGVREAVACGEGCVLDFLQYETADGYIPILVKAQVPPKDYIPVHPDATNMHKPVLAQHAAFVTELNHGDAEWLRSAFPKLEAFLRNYHDHRRNVPTGLYCWQDDAAIGVDNDPCTFFRPPNSSGSIYLNCLMYKELKAMAYLAQQLHLPPEKAAFYAGQAEELKAAIQKNCWDERDGFFYSVDLDLLPFNPKPREVLGGDFILHEGHPRDYNCLIQRIEVWSGLMAMWAGIATPEQARRIVQEHVLNPRTLGAAYGVRSLSKMEKMYGIYFSGNPSNWHGPVWGISNYMAFEGMKHYGFDAEARDMAAKTIRLFGHDYATSGTLHESYNPDTGAENGNPGFQDWNYLVLNMIDYTQGRPVIEEF